MKVSLLKISNDIKVFFCAKRHLLFFLKRSPVNTKKLFFRLNKKIIFVTNKQIVVTEIFSHFKKFKSNRNRIFSNFFYINEQFQYFLKMKKLKIKLTLIGIGFKFFIHSNPCLLEIKVGYSHNIFFKLPKHIEIFSKKLTEIILIGGFSRTFFNLVTSIKKIRLPDPYKKKGIFYSNEIIKTKRGKTS